MASALDQNYIVVKQNGHSARVAVSSDLRNGRRPRPARPRRPQAPSVWTSGTSPVGDPGSHRSRWYGRLWLISNCPPERWLSVGDRSL